MIYIDLDGDLNTPATGDGVLDWMGLAHILGIDGVASRLADAGPRTPLLPSQAVYLVGADLLTEPERRVVQQLDIRRESVAVVRTDLEAVLDRLLTWASAFDRILIHIDIDVLYCPAFPIAHEVRAVPGLTIDELHLLGSRVRQIPQWVGLTLCEVNPNHATDVARQFTRLVSLLRDAVWGCNHSCR